MNDTKNYTLLNNSRFYILTTAVLLSILIPSIIRLNISTDQLFYIRTQQFFGFISIFYWYLALIISPMGYLIGKNKIKHLEFARRAIGVSAAYFATLHAGVAFWGQLGGARGFNLLPDLFKWSIAGGLFGVIVLFMMSATSFDKVIKIMTYKKWKWLHRLGYIGGVFSVLHVWSLGTHLGSGFVQLISFGALVILSGLELFRVVTLLARKYKSLEVKSNFIISYLVLWLVTIALIGSIPYVVDSYRSDHSKHDNSSHGGGHSHE